MGRGMGFYGFGFFAHTLSFSHPMGDKHSEKFERSVRFHRGFRYCCHHFLATGDQCEYDNRAIAGGGNTTRDVQLWRVISDFHDGWSGPSHEYKHEAFYVSIIRHYFSCNEKYDVVWLAFKKIRGNLIMKKRDEINAFLGKDTEFEGKLSFKGAVRIDGHFTGEIFTEGTLIVGELAIIESNIHVSHIIISGEIRGNIIADNRIEIHAPGKVFGNIQAPTVVIEEGVIFEGNCSMRGIGQAEDKKLAVIS